MASNSFSALEGMPEEEDTGDTAANGSNKQHKGKFKYPLVWIDLEMTGASRWGGCNIASLVSDLVESAGAAPSDLRPCGRSLRQFAYS